MKIAIVTGASSGLGREFVRQIQGVDEIWAIARREEKLEELHAECSIRVVPMPLDLTFKKSIDALRSKLEEEKPIVKILINAAGFGKMGNWDEVPFEDNSKMIDLNCRALVDVTTTVLPHVTGGSSVINICSSSAFQPLPGLNTYASTKAFIYSYSRALRREVEKKGIRVITVCPYWIKDTEFVARAQKGGNPNAVRNFRFSLTSNRVVKGALRVKKAVYTPGAVAKAQRVFSKVLPCGIVMRGWDKLRKI